MSDASKDSSAGNHIAIVGMAGRFPGARTLADYWRNLCGGVESVRFFTPEELLAAGESPDNLADPSYVPAWPVLEDIELFDAGFFGMSPRDAAVMDPQHRFFLEVAWAALENAGYEPESAPGSVGVFAACGMNTYMMHHLVTNHEVMETVGEWLVRHTGNDMNFLATRVSYQMNLKGPSLNVQTACSSALTAVHLACQSLLNGECDTALAGASTMSLPQDKGYLFKEGEILSRDGHCRPFDAGSRGTLFGSGTGCVVLRRLDDAVADGDQVLAVIRGSAYNNDGSQKVGYLAPSVEGQARAVAEALAISDTDPESISYIETHGTGTAIGDPIEVTALTQAYRAQTDKRGFCAIGSVKANIGHLGEAAGMAGLIKTVLSLEKRQLPPSINYSAPNPEIDFAASPFFVNDKLRPWQGNGGKLRAGITALGAGGTNVHLIVEEPPRLPASGPARKAQLLLLSAKSAAALEQATANLAEHLAQNPGLNLADVAFTLQTGRKAFGHRRLLVADSVAGAAAALRARDPKQLPTQARGREKPSVIFMFPGGGAQYASMGQELYETEPVYKAAFDECLAALPPERAAEVRGLVFAPKDHLAEASTRLERPSLALPALFAAEYATARLLSAWGVEAAGFIGHSMGEYVAACLAGVISVRDGVRLVTTRGRLFETLPAGGMLSVALPEAELRALLEPALSIAAVNSPTLCVASGPVEAIDRLQKLLEAREVETTRIHISVAAHSSMLEPLLKEFETFCRTIQWQPPKLPFISNLTGTWIKPEEATDPLYWVRHLRQTVRFGDGVAALLDGADRVLVEIGPGRTLSSLSRQQTPPPAAAVPTMRHPRETASDVAFLLETVGRIWLAGARPDFAKLHGVGKRRRLPLPTYPFERQRYWIEAGQPTAQSARRKGSPRKKADITQWFYAPTWKRSPAPPPDAPEANAGPWLLFCDGVGVGERLAARLGKNVVRVVPGDQFRSTGDLQYELRPGVRADYEMLVDDLLLRECYPQHVVHLWALTPPPPAWLPGLRGGSRPEDYDAAEGFCFGSLLSLAQELGGQERPLVLSVVSNGLHQVGADAGCQPEKALLLGPTRVIPREFPQIRTRSIDVALPGRGAAAIDQVAERLFDELCAPPTDGTVALRGPSRWVQAFDPLPLPPAGGRSPVRPGGVYLITGGLGGIGLELAEHLARTAQAKLVLIGRSGLPDRAQWPELVAQGGAVGRRIQKVLAIEAAGGQVMAAGADVTNRVQLREVLAEIHDRFGKVNGIVHSAGLIDDGLISLKTREAAANVIGVKAKGALILDEVFGREPLDFFVVFSSVSSILGLEGQIDYTAANAFLDAFAQRKSQDGRTQALSINWNAWQEIGMAVSLAERPGQVQFAQAASHPCLERIALETDETRVFVTSFSRTKHWLLSEHVVHGGDALIPGTGYLELARAALEHVPQSRAVELRDVTFLSPFAVRVGESRDLRLALATGGPSAGEFTFFSTSESEPHVTGRIEYVDKSAPPPVDLGALAARCNVSERVYNGPLDQSFMTFGPRWSNVERIRFGSDEALISIALPEAFASDLGDFRLHPAALDMATGGAQPLIGNFDPARDFYVPFAYGRVTLYRPLPARFHSHVRHRRNGTHELAVFDLTLVDERGEVLAEIANFTMKRVAQAAALTGNAVTRTGEEAAAPARPEREVAGSRIGSALRQGILPAEGMDAFDRILAARLTGQIVASSVDLHDWLAQVEADARPVAASDGAAAGSEGFARPSVSAEFVAPRNQVERELAAMWRELLGLKEVGVHDDFFDLGGQSLVAVRLFNKIRKRWGIDLPLSTLFEAPNIEGCARIVAEDAGITLVNEEAGAAATDHGAPAAPEPKKEARPKKSRWTALVVMQAKGTLPPVFCVAGMGGTLNNLRKLALLAGTNRPFYGLQPPGTDDPSKLLYSVDDLADFYLREIRAVQPHGPYYLSGYSGGGIASFEMARRLTAEGEKVAFLGFIDSYAPELPQRSMAERAQIHLKRLSDRGPEYVVDTLKRRLNHDSYHLGRKITRKLRRVFPDRFRYLIVEDSWLVAQDHYRPPPWPGKATLFRAREVGAISLWTAVKDDDQHGWGRYLDGGVDVEYIPGDHTTMCEEPNVRVLAAKFRDCLDRATAEQAGDQPSPPPAPEKVSVTG